jgi:hypothetical protein
MLSSGVVFLLMTVGFAFCSFWLASVPLLAHASQPRVSVLLSLAGLGVALLLMSAGLGVVPLLMLANLGGAFCSC